MDLEGIFSKSLSKETNKEVSNWIGHSQERFDQLMPIFLADSYRICQRAAWVFGKVCEERPELMMSWLPKILKALDDPQHDAIVRNTVRAFQFMECFPEEYEGEIYERCFGYLSDPSTAVAIKVFSMTVCSKTARRYPELKTELIAVIEEHLPHGTAGFKSRAKKVLERLSSE